MVAGAYSTVVLQQEKKGGKKNVEPEPSRKNGRTPGIGTGDGSLSRTQLDHHNRHHHDGSKKSVVGQ